ncbi:hypothetical protein [Geoglobus sp.]
MFYMLRFEGLKNAYEHPQIDYRMKQGNGLRLCCLHLFNSFAFVRSVSIGFSDLQICPPERIPYSLPDDVEGLS